jgi:hypothetical protein
LTAGVAITVAPLAELKLAAGDQV